MTQKANGRVGARFSKEARAVAAERLSRNKLRSEQGKGPLAVWDKRTSRRNARRKS